MATQKKSCRTTSPRRKSVHKTDLTKSADGAPLFSENKGNRAPVKEELDAWQEGMEITSTRDPDLAVRQVASAMSTFPGNEKQQAHSLKLSQALLKGIQPRDQLESLLATQMIGIHNLTMESMKQAVRADQTAEGFLHFSNQAAKLSKTFTNQLETLNRYRGKGEQKMTVEHIHLHQGGQAIVGEVHHEGAGGRIRK